MLHGRNRPFPRTSGNPAALAGQSWQAAVIANGGSVSAGRLVIVNNFIAAEMAAGTWALTDDYWGLWAEDTIGALVSLKQRRMGGTFGAPSFVPSQGYTFDGVANYLNTLFVQATHAVVSTGLNMRVAVYERTAVSLGTYAIGATTGATAGARLSPRNGVGGNVATIMNGTSTISVATVPTSLGYTVAFKAAANTYGFYKNGLLLENYDPAGESTALGTQPIFIGATNSTGVAASFRASSVGFACFGASLTAPQELAQYNNVQNWATSIGANV